MRRIQVIAVLLIIIISSTLPTFVSAQVTPIDTTLKTKDSATLSIDTTLRIKNLNPYFNLHVDSILNYNLEINKNEEEYYWYLRNAPLGLKINKDNGTLTLKPEKALFLSGRLKYDQEYKVQIGVQNLDHPKEKIDTFFTIVFYNTEIIPSKVKPTVSNVLIIDEGETVSFKVQCENGSFPIDHITFYANTPLKNFTLVKACDDEFTWVPPFDFVKETDSAKTKIVVLNFVGTNRFMQRDTAQVKLIIRDALNYPVALQDHSMITKNINTYILQLKYTFLQLDKTVKKTKSTRTTFDITSSTTALTGSLLNTSSNTGTKKIGQVMPSIGVSLVPVKEAVAPQKVFDQNQASLIRTAIKRLDYMVRDNSLVGEKDPEIAKKTQRLKDELKQTQIQLIDVPLEISQRMSEEDLNNYFNSPEVNKKYRLKK